MMFTVSDVSGFVLESIWLPYFGVGSCRHSYPFDTEERAIIEVYKIILLSEFNERNGYWLCHVGMYNAQYVIYRVAYRTVTVSPPESFVLVQDSVYRSDHEFEWLDDALKTFDEELGGLSRV